MLRNSPTFKIMALGFGFALIAAIPVYAEIFDKYWPWASTFPLGWISLGAGYMSIFFHELGHTVTMWFYGYPTLPSFDFEHGGGMAYRMSGQKIFILIAVWAAIGYGIWVLQNYRRLQYGLGALLVFNLAFAFNEYHNAIYTFMGPLAEILVASFLLYRALFDLAPRGVFERFLNSFFGFTFIIYGTLDALGLIANSLHRLNYYNQKGQHGFGDFDRVAEQIPFMGFNGVVSLWLLFAMLLLAVPFYLYLNSKYKNA